MSKGIKYEVLSEGEAQFISLDNPTVQAILKTYEKKHQQMKQHPSWNRKLQKEKRMSQKIVKESINFCGYLKLHV